MRNSKWDYDERQMQIAGKLYRRGFLTACIILPLNGLLQGQGVVWASGFHQNFLIMLLLHTITSFEAILRGVYFGKCNQLNRWAIIGVFGFVSLFLWIVSIWRLVQGASFLESNALTSFGFSLVSAAMLTVTAVVGIIKEIMDNRKKAE